MDMSADNLKLVELYEILLRDGTYLRRTTNYADITYTEDSNVYTAAPGMMRSDISYDSDASEAECKITMPRVSPWVDPVRLPIGYLDGAYLVARVIDRTDHSNGKVIFKGYTGSINYSYTGIEISFTSAMGKQRRTIPRRKYTRGCGHPMYGTRCKLNRNDWTVPGTIDAGSTTVQLLAADVVDDAGYFDRGIITFTTGALAGEARWVKSYAVGVFNLYDALPAAPAESDQFEALPFCGKTFDVCRDTYSNQLNYGGHQHIPTQDEAYT